MRIAIEESNRRREKQVRYNIEHQMLPRKAQKSGSGQSLLLGQEKAEYRNDVAYPIVEEHYATAADIEKSYVASENIDALITKAREDMERMRRLMEQMKQEGGETNGV